MGRKGQSTPNPFANLPEGVPFAYQYQGQLWKMRILVFKNGQPPAMMYSNNEHR